MRVLWPEKSPYRAALAQIEEALAVVCRLSKRTREVLAQLPSSEELESAITGRRGDADEVGATFVANLWNRLLGRALLKCEDGTRLLIFSTNKKNLYGIALAARAIIEHVALVTHLSDRTVNFTGRDLPHAEFAEFIHEMYRLAIIKRRDTSQILRGSFKRGWL